MITNDIEKYTNDPELIAISKQLTRQANAAAAYFKANPKQSESIRKTANTKKNQYLICTANEMPTRSAAYDFDCIKEVEFTHEGRDYLMQWHNI